MHYPLCASAILARKRCDRSKVRLAKSITSKIRYLLTFVRGRIDGWFQFGLQISSHMLPHSRGRSPVRSRRREKGLMLEQGQQEEDRAEERLINTRGGEQVSQTNVIYRVSIPHSADR